MVTKVGSRTAAKASRRPTLLAGGNPQIAKAEGDVPVQAYIAAMPGWKRHVGEMLDRLIVHAFPQVLKAVKWNSPFYGSPASGWFLSFHCHAEYVKVAFFNGTLLQPLPPGASKQPRVRYLDLHQGSELDQKQFSAWVTQASRLPGWQMATPNPSIERTSSGIKSSAAADANSGPPLSFEDRETWFRWLRKNHATSSGVWLRFAKKGAVERSVSYLQAVDAALCFGWIDGQKKSGDATCWLQRFTPRSEKSIWSKINREKAIRLIELGQMHAAGLGEVERAKRDGRWDGAYDSPGGATIPADFQAVLDKNPRAKAFFAGLDGRNRYAMLFRIQTAKKAETRAKRIRQFADMLSQREKIYP